MRPPSWLPIGLPLLDDRCPLPLDRPFTVRQAHQLGVPGSLLRRLVADGFVRRVVAGAYAVSQAPDDVQMRARALALVVPDSLVVTDETAAWLHGVDVMPPSAIREAPPLHLYQTDGTRVRRPGVESGTRMMLPSDIVVVEGIRSTSMLRTACDLGRRRWRFRALGALDAFLHAGLDHEELLGEVQRFRGFRGVVQLRTLAPLADGRAESMAESALRLHWEDTGLPRPELQHWVYDDDGVGVYRLDLALPDLAYSAEYDGVDFHSSDEQRAYDATRRRWLVDERGWLIDVFEKDDVFRRGADPGAVLRIGVARARKRLGLWTPYGMV